MTATKFVYVIHVVHTEDPNIEYFELFDSFPTYERIVHYLDWVSVCDLEVSKKLAESFLESKEGESPIIDRIQVIIYKRKVRNGNR